MFHVEHTCFVAFCCVITRQVIEAYAFINTGKIGVLIPAFVPFSVVDILSVA